MPIGDIAGEVLGGVLRFVGNLIIDFVPELLLRAPGYLLCKPFKKDIDPDGGLCQPGFLAGDWHCGLAYLSAAIRNPRHGSMSGFRRSL